MPRHNLKKYDPVSESTPGLKTEAADRKALCLNTKTREGADSQARNGRPSGCPCGCEGEPVGGKRIFLMGHDARLRGKLIRAHLTGTPVARFQDGKFLDQRTAMADAKEYGESFVTALKGADMRVKQASAKLVETAKGSKRLIKVGRWKYTGQVAAVFNTPRGEEYEVKYVTKTGETKTVRVPASEAPLAEAQKAVA